MTPEWISAIVAGIAAVTSALNLWQTTRIKLAIADLKLWVHENFVSKTDHLTMLELWNRNDGVPPHKQKS